MESKQIEVDCPCCRSRLLVDVRTQTVMRSARPEELDTSGKPKVSEEDWDQALGKVRGRAQDREQRMQAAVDREKERQSKLDQLFDDARRKLEQDQGDGS